MLLVLFGSLAFVAADLWLLVVDHLTPLYKVTISLSTLVFCFFAIIAWQKLRSNEPALIIDELGITDNASALAVGFLPWEQVLGAEICVLGHQGVIVMHVADETEILARQPGLKRILLKMNRPLIGTIVCIPATVLAMPLESVLDNMEVLASHRNIHNQTASS